MLAIILVFIDKFNFFDFIIRTNIKSEALITGLKVYMTNGEFVFNIIASIVMLVAVIATIFSGWSYLKGGKDLLKDA